MSQPATSATPFRCAGASLLRNEPAVGTASTVRAFLLLEHPGPWGSEALRDARLPDRLGGRIQAAAGAAGVRVLLVRRPGRARAEVPRVFAAYADPVAPWLESGPLADPHEVLDLDLAALRAGRSVGLSADPDPMFCVCTHGRHDVCCAERGRPVAAALCQSHPAETWEVSHIGGDRFAANMLVLPHGLYYGRLEPVSAIAVAGAHSHGHLDLDRLRGRSGLPPAVQLAEVALRRELAETREGAVAYTGREVEGDLTRARFEVAGAGYEVVLRSSRGDQQRLTCQAQRDNPVPVHEVVQVGRLPGS